MPSGRYTRIAVRHGRKEVGRTSLRARHEPQAAMMLAPGRGYDCSKTLTNEERLDVLKMG